MRGSSDPTGSWKTICAFCRKARRSFADAERRSTSSKTTDPLVAGMREETADIVRQRRIAQQLPLPVAIIMQAQRAELVEEREGQLLDVERMRLVKSKRRWTRQLLNQRRPL